MHAKLIETLANLARLDAKNKGNPEPVKTVDYRGIKVYAVEKNKFAVVEDWLVVTNKDELGKQIVDRFLDKPKTSLAADAQFAKAHAAVERVNDRVGVCEHGGPPRCGLGEKVVWRQGGEPADRVVRRRNS